MYWSQICKYICKLSLNTERSQYYELVPATPQDVASSQQSAVFFVVVGKWKLGGSGLSVNDSSQWQHLWKTKWKALRFCFTSPHYEVVIFFSFSWVIFVWIWPKFISSWLFFYKYIYILLLCTAVMKKNREKVPFPTRIQPPAEVIPAISTFFFPLERVQELNALFSYFDRRYYFGLVQLVERKECYRHLWYNHMSTCL